jgi:hypothetical protein
MRTPQRVRVLKLVTAFVNVNDRERVLNTEPLFGDPNKIFLILYISKLESQKYKGGQMIDNFEF